MAGQTLLPVQQLDRALAVLGLSRAARRRFSCHGDVGRLQQGPRPEKHRESVSGTRRRRNITKRCWPPRRRGVVPPSIQRRPCPDWDGYYQRDNTSPRRWWVWGVEQPSTLVSCSPRSIRSARFSRMYHEAVNNAPQWNASFCYPEGFIRWWGGPSRRDQFQLTMTPWMVQTLSVSADNFIRQVMIGKPNHVQKVPQCYGETIGFSDGTTLISWTANIQAGR